MEFPGRVAWGQDERVGLSTSGSGTLVRYARNKAASVDCSECMVHAWLKPRENAGRVHQGYRRRCRDQSVDDQRDHGGAHEFLSARRVAKMLTCENS